MGLFGAELYNPDKPCHALSALNRHLIHKSSEVQILVIFRDLQRPGKVSDGT